MHGLAMQVSGQGFGGSKQYQSGDYSRDHFRENVRRMRQIQRKAREREVETAQPVKALWKSEKYSEVQSRIKFDIEKEPETPRPRSASYLRAHSRAGPPVPLQSRPCTPEPKLSVPPASSSGDVKMNRNSFDFIKINGIAARHEKMPRAPSLSALDDLKKKQDDEYKRHKKGEVPTYLRKRVEQWKKDETARIENTPDPACPEGHRVLPESERRDTLDLLRQKQAELTGKLNSLPLRTDTFRMRTVKQDLESKLAEMEEAIKIFSRPKVFVKVE